MAKAIAKSITERTAIVNIKSPKAVADFAKELKKFVVEQKLYTEIKGKNYVNVEGWQFAGASMGLFPIPTILEDLSTDKEKKYKAIVELMRIETGEVVGRGFAICSSLESMRKGADEFVIASMAQTRATGKSFRLSIGWVMKLAGYEATPAEDMEIIESESQITTPDISISDIKYLVGIKLSAMSAADKMRALKSTGKISESKLSDQDYRNLYIILANEG